MEANISRVRARKVNEHHWIVSLNLYSEQCKTLKMNTIKASFFTSKTPAGIFRFAGNYLFRLRNRSEFELASSLV